MMAKKYTKSVDIDITIDHVMRTSNVNPAIRTVKCMTAKLADKTRELRLSWVEDPMPIRQAVISAVEELGDLRYPSVAEALVEAVLEYCSEENIVYIPEPPPGKYYIWTVEASKDQAMDLEESVVSRLSSLL